MSPAEAVIGFENVSKRFGSTVAVDRVDLCLNEGRVLGIVGESGSGKSTCVRMALGLERPSEGRLLFRGSPYSYGRRPLRDLRKKLGFVFQDPYDSLNGRMKIGEAVAEPLQIHGTGRREALRRAAELLDAVGLPDADLDSLPEEYSGGGRQRIAIARGLAVDPEILLCDEPTASLDASVQAQIINLLLELKTSRKLSLIFVSHDLRLVRRIADDVAVMKEGRILESGPVGKVLETPEDAYTRRLLDARPGDHPARRRLTEPVREQRPLPKPAPPKTEGARP